MALSVREVRLWLAELDGDDSVAIDDGGLCLVAVDTPDQGGDVADAESYIEVGGVPLPQEEGER